MSNFSVSGWDSGLPQRGGGLSSRGQWAGIWESMTTQCVQCYKRGHAGPRGSPAQRGVDVKVQENQVGKDVLNITHSLSAGPKKGGGQVNVFMAKGKREEEVCVPAMMY